MTHQKERRALSSATSAIANLWSESAGSLEHCTKMMFKVSVMFAIATLAVAANADGERFCNGNVDPADCKDLAGLCDNALISGKT